MGKALLISLNPQDQALLYYPGDTNTDPRPALWYRNIVVELIPNPKVSFLAKAAASIDFYDDAGKQRRKKNSVLIKTLIGLLLSFESLC